MPSEAWNPETRRGRRRLGFVLLVVLVVLLGAGIGTLVSDGPSPGVEPPVVTVTPTETPTDTATPTDGAPTDGTPTDGTPTATPDGDDSDGDGSGTGGDADTGDSGGNGSGSDSGSGGGSGGGSGSSGGGSGGGSGPAVSLQTVGSTAILNYDHVAPDQAGRDAVRLRNAGSQAGRLSVADVAVTDAENGLVGPEAAVDNSPDEGELSRNVFVIVEVQYPNGSVGSLSGTGDGARPLSAIADEPDPATGGSLGPGEEATVVFDWHVPARTGNEIQSDSATVDVTFGLEST